MTRGAKGCLVAAGAMLFVLVVVAAIVLLSGGVRRGSILELTIAGEIVEDHEETIQSRLFRGKVTLLRDITRALDRASRDDNVNGLVARIKPFQMGLGKIQDIREAVIRFRGSGKWAHVYLDSAGEFSSGNGVYYLASAFDEIWMAPAGDLNLLGLLSVTPFYRGIFDKLGIYPDLDSIGEYKSAKDIYTEKSMTEAHREANTTLMQDLYDQMVEGIARERSMAVDEVDALIQTGPFTGAEALEHGFVDHLAYDDEFAEAMEELNEGDLDLLGPEEYLERLGAPSGSRIAVITGMGIIVTGRSVIGPFGDAAMGSETITASLRAARDDGSIKGIIFRVDSPGGSPLASDLMWREVQLAAREKPVIISMSDAAASGGYYLSLPATKVVSQPGTLTGSIGVVAGKMVTTGFYDWIGLHREAIKVGQNATYYYSGEKYTDTERSIFKKMLHKTYEDFTSRVAEARGMTLEEVDAVGRGHVWSGSRALELGLVDELGGLLTAIDVAKEEAGIPEEREVRLVYLPERRTFLQNLLWPEEETAGAHSGLPPEVTAVLRDVSRMMILARENVWMIAEPVAVP